MRTEEPYDDVPPHVLGNVLVVPQREFLAAQVEGVIASVPV
ncbi:hypothetical protein [Streptomyces sp. NPDC001978]